MSMRRILPVVLAMAVTVAVVPSAASAGTVGATRATGPRTLRVVAGTTVGSLDALAVRDQSGTDDDPAAYLHVVPDEGRFDVRFSFRAGSPSLLGTLHLAASIRSSSNGWWRLQVRDRVVGKWVTIHGSDDQRPRG